MKSKMMFVLLVPMFLSAAPSRAASVSSPDDDCEISLLCDDRMKELSGIFGGNDMAAKDEALLGLFDATQTQKSEPVAVSVGPWGRASSGISMFVQPIKSPPLAAKNEPRIVLAAELEHRDMMESASGDVRDKVVGKVIDKVIEKVDKANKAIDSVGNGLRDDGDAALQKGTEDQKKAERKYGKQ